MGKSFHWKMGHPQNAMGPVETIAAAVMATVDLDLNIVSAQDVLISGEELLRQFS